MRRLISTFSCFFIIVVLMLTSCDVDNTYEIAPTKATVFIKSSTTITPMDQELAFMFIGSTTVISGSPKKVILKTTSKGKISDNPNKVISSTLYEVIYDSDGEKILDVKKISDAVIDDDSGSFNFDVSTLMKGKKEEPDNKKISVRVEGKFKDGESFTYPYTMSVASSFSITSPGVIVYQKKTTDLISVGTSSKQSAIALKEAFVEWKKNKGGTYARDNNFIFDFKKLQAGEKQSIAIKGFTNTTYGYGLSIGDTLYYRFNIKNSADNIEQKEIMLPLKTQTLENTQGSTKKTAISLSTSNENFVLKGGIFTKEVAKAEIKFDKTLIGLKAVTNTSLKFIKVDLTANSNADAKIYENQDMLRVKSLADTGSSVSQIKSSKGDVYVYKIERTLPSKDDKIVEEGTKDATNKSFTFYGLLKMGDVSSKNGDYTILFEYMEGVLDL